MENREISFQNLQDDIVTDNIRTSKLIKYARILAKRIKDEEMLGWFTLENSGYFDILDLDYRTVQGTYYSSDGLHVYNMPASKYDLQNIFIQNSVKEIEEMIDSCENDIVYLKIPEEILESINLKNIIFGVDKISLIGVLEYINSKLLSWVVDNMDKQPINKRKQVDNQEYNSIKFDGNSWSIVFNRDFKTIKATLGMDIIVYLIIFQGYEIASTTIRNAVTGLNKNFKREYIDLVNSKNSDGKKIQKDDQIKLVDEQTIREVKDMMAKLNKDLDEAEKINDYAEINRLEHQIKKYEVYYKSSVTKIGKSKIQPDQLEKDRKAVYSAFLTAKNNLKIHKQFYKHIDRHVNMGKYCSYKPPNSEYWHITK